MNFKNIADRCRWARQRANLSQSELASRAIVSVGVIGNVESGRNQTIRQNTAVARAMGVDPTWLAEGKGEPYPAVHELIAAASGVPAVALHEIMYLDLNEVRMILQWRDADAETRSLIDSAFAVAGRLAALPDPAQRKA